MVSGCVGFVGDFALTFGSSWSSTARFVRKVSSFFQVYSTLLGDRSTYTRCLLTRAAVTISCGDNSAPTQQSVANGPNQPWYEVVGVVRDLGIDPEDRDRGATREGPASITRWFLAEVIPSAWPSIPPAIPCSSPHACGPSPETSSPRCRSRRSPASIKSQPQVPVR